MKVFDLTPRTKNIPLASDWADDAPAHDLPSEKPSRQPCASEIAARVMSAARPLRRLEDQGFSLEWLSFWEAYSCFLENREGDAAINTFHICDNQRFSIDTLQRFLGRSAAKWTWRATYNSQAGNFVANEPAKWSLGVDGEGRVNVSNMRSWRNWIQTSGQRVDIVVGASPRHDDIVGEIVFSLVNLSVGGSALIRIPHETLPNITPIIHLFSQFFASTRMIYTLAADQIYLCGLDIEPRDCKTLKMLMARAAGWPTFTPEYIKSDSYSSTSAALLAVREYLRDTARAEREKMAAICAEISKSASMKLFGVDQYLESKYRDRSDDWERATNFTT